MKSINKVFIYITGLLILLSVLITSGIYLYNYISKVILTKPFNLIIEGLSEKQTKIIHVFGYSPTGKFQSLSKNSNNKWGYSLYSNFENLIIYLPDTSTVIKQIKILSKNKVIVIKNIKRERGLCFFNPTTKIKLYSSKLDALFSFYFWKESKILILLVLIIVISILLIALFYKKRFPIISYINVAIKSFMGIRKIFTVTVILLIIAHLLFFILTGNYLITSGIFVIIAISFLFYTLINIINKAFFNKTNEKEIRLAVIAVTSLFTIIELVFLFTGYKITEEEKREFLYSSIYESNKLSHYYHWSSDHNLKTEEYNFFRKVNSDYLSDKEHPVNKKNNEYRIIGLGDSFTEGDGADTDSTWLKFLERRLKNYSLKKQLTFFNAGVCGSDLFFEYMLLKGKLLKYKPDLVIVAINCSDVDEISVRGGMERFQPDGTVKYKKPPWWEPIYATVHISRLFFSALDYNELLIKETDLVKIEISKKFIQIIEKFEKLSIVNNFKLLFVFHPIKDEIIINRLSLSSVLTHFKYQKSNITFDMLDYFVTKENVKNSNCSNLYWKYDRHHNAKGYELFAKGVEWKLKEMGIIDSLKKD